MMRESGCWMQDAGWGIKVSSFRCQGEEVQDAGYLTTDLDKYFAKK